MKRMTGNKIFVLFFSVICVAICVFSAQLLSSVITVSGENTNITNGEFGGYIIYAVSVGAYTTESQAKTVADTVLKKNAGGYVYKKDEIYHVIASAYEIENDAKLVQNNLQSSGTTSEIINISVENVAFKEVSSSHQKKSFCSALSYLKTVFVALYDISVSLDTNVIDNTKAKIEIIEVKSKLESTLESIEKGNTSVDGIYYQMIKNQYSKIEMLLIDLKNYENEDGISLSAKVKNTYLTMLCLAKDLSEILNNEI